MIIVYQCKFEFFSMLLHDLRHWITTASNLMKENYKTWLCGIKFICGCILQQMELGSFSRTMSSGKVDRMKHSAKCEKIDKRWYLQVLYDFGPLMYGPNGSCAMWFCGATDSKKDIFLLSIELSPLRLWKIVRFNIV